MPRSTGAKAQVERAAIELFAARGVDGVSIGEIATAAGVSQGALYRHYKSKEDLARTLFSTAYLRMGAELDAIRAREPDFRRRIAAMVAHFCALYDSNPALFRFLLLAQHNFLPHLGDEPSAPPAVMARTVAAAIESGETAPIDPALGAAVIMGVVLQTATFHLYGRITGSLAAGALARAAVGAVEALGESRP
jgi:AcrR family transcriptional regulator